MSQNIALKSNVLDMTLSAKILTTQFREITEEYTFKIILQYKNTKHVTGCPVIQHIKLITLV